MNKSKVDTKTIDSLNAYAWDNRYSSYDEALSHAERAVAFSDEIGYEKGKAYGNLNLAVCYFLKSNNEDAFPLLQEALLYFKDRQKEKGYVNTMLHIGNIYESYGEYEKALEFSQKALNCAKENEYKEGLGDVYSVLGTIYSRLSDYDSAQKAYLESLEIRQGIGNSQAIASSLNRLAQSYCLKKDYVKALEYYSQSRLLRERIEKYSGISWTYLGMASTFEYMGELDDANKYYSMGAEHHEVDVRCKAQCLIGSGRINRKQRVFNTSVKELHAAEEIALSLNAKPLQYSVCLELAKLYEALEEPYRALEYFKKYHTLKEEVLNSETTNKLKNQQIVFAIEKSEKEKEIYQLRNIELKTAYDQINEKSIEITDSIHYALRIQSAMLPKADQVCHLLPEHFVLFLPKNIVSGDFYWVSSVNDKVIIVAADCTGHGVPGAFMSMLGMSFLNDIVNRRKTTNPSKILSRLRKMIIKALKQKDVDIDSQDGMDIAICVLDKNESILEFAGAFNPLIYIRKGELFSIPANRVPVGISSKLDEEFITHSHRIIPGDKFYIFSDGYQDQFGGKKGKKLKSSGLKEILLETSSQEMASQGDTLKEYFDSWKSDNEQLDDVIIFGFEI